MLLRGLNGLNGFTGFTGFTGREICPFILVSTWPFDSVFFDFFALPFIWAAITGQPKECLGTYPELSDCPLSGSRVVKEKSVEPL